MNKYVDYIRQNKNQINRISQKLNNEIKAYKFNYMVEIDGSLKIADIGIEKELEIIIQYYPSSVKVVNVDKYIYWTFNVKSPFILSIFADNSYDCTEVSVSNISKSMIENSVSSKTPEYSRVFTPYELDTYIQHKSNQITTLDIINSDLFMELNKSLKDLVDSKITILRSSKNDAFSSISDKSLFPIISYDIEKDVYCIDQSTIIRNKINGTRQRVSNISQKEFNFEYFYRAVQGIDFTIKHGGDIIIPCKYFKIKK